MNAATWAVRRTSERGQDERGWLSARFSFSFGRYRNADWNGFGDLHALNENVIAPGRGFPMHSHRDVDILLYPLSGAIEHVDSLGNRGIVGVGELQLMRAGHGIRHSQMNASASEPDHHLQIWIRPAATGLPPGVETRRLDPAARRGRWCRLAGPDGADGALVLAQNAQLFVTERESGQSLTWSPGGRRRTYLHVIRGEVLLEGTPLIAGDGAARTDSAAWTLHAQQDCEVLLFDLA